jgi:hypothetical protein
MFYTSAENKGKANETRRSNKQEVMNKATEATVTRVARFTRTPS